MPLDALIVDDSSAIRKILTRVVQNCGLDLGTVHEAGDGAEALAKLRTQPFAFVLSDINMPNMDGLELLKAMRADEALKDIPVFMITTEGSTDKVSQAASYGATGYLRKPFTPEQVREHITSAIGTLP